MPDQEPNQESSPDVDDIKAKMREALERKKAGARSGSNSDNPLREKAHGSEVAGGAAPKMHRRKAGGGGS